jgi:hypothetical protein
VVYFAHHQIIYFCEIGASFNDKVGTSFEKIVVKIPFINVQKSQIFYDTKGHNKFATAWL